jgi:hypothetical protein
MLGVVEGRPLLDAGREVREAEWEVRDGPGVTVRDDQPWSVTLAAKKRVDDDHKEDPEDDPEDDDVAADEELEELDEDLGDEGLDEDDDEYPEIDDDLIDLDDEWDEADEDERHDNPHRFYE